MIALTAVVISVLFGCAVSLMLTPDLFKVAAGTMLLTNSAILFLVGKDLGAHAEAIFPLRDLGDVSDPLAQALVITAIVIGFGITALLLRVGLSVAAAHGTCDLEALRRLENVEREERS